MYMYMYMYIMYIYVYVYSVYICIFCIYVFIYIYIYQYIINIHICWIEGNKPGLTASALTNWRETCVQCATSTSRLSDGLRLLLVGTFTGRGGQSTCQGWTKRLLIAEKSVTWLHSRLGESPGKRMDLVMNPAHSSQGVCCETVADRPEQLVARTRESQNAVMQLHHVTRFNCCRWNFSLVEIVSLPKRRSLTSYYCSTVQHATSQSGPASPIWLVIWMLTGCRLGRT